MTNGIFYLDWDSYKLFGWEPNKLGIYIASLVKGVDAGDEFPPVEVMVDEHCPKVVYLAGKSRLAHLDGTVDGGHKRGLAHRIAGKLLKCRAIPFNRDIRWVNVPIEDTILEYNGEIDFERLKEHQKIFPNYRRLSKEEYENFAWRFPNGRRVSARL
jgi:hypothetical protein